MSLVTQSNPPWGLSRIFSHQRSSTVYTYDDSAGADTCAYVFDSGIDADHPEFEGRSNTIR
jgi:subtilisin family serine protease